MVWVLAIPATDPISSVTRDTGSSPLFNFRYNYQIECAVDRINLGNPGKYS